jgi:hypothetical protein
VHMNMAAAASIPSEIFDMSPPLQNRSQVTVLSRIVQEPASGWNTPTSPAFIYTFLLFQEEI